MGVTVPVREIVTVTVPVGEGDGVIVGVGVDDADSAIDIVGVGAIEDIVPVKDGDNVGITVCEGVHVGELEGKAVSVTLK